MCGITGYIDHTSATSAETLTNMATALQHRGPDDAGYEIIDQEKYRLGLAHRRLSIIDLSSSGHQPMRFKELSIVFNGEIYNYSSIRKELEEEFNCSFVSRSDTEVILQAFYYYGISCLERFIGMFAIALFDGRDQKLYLIRDRAGVKPLYYYHKDGLLLFASELKAFHEHSGFEKGINISALRLFLQYGYIPSPYSIFHHTRKVNPGHYLVYDLLQGVQKEKKYWDVYDFYNQPVLDISYPDARDELHSLLKSAFNYRMVSDVPVGIFLSGGYDSTAVAALLQNMHSEPLKTFTIGFDEKSHDEAVHAKKVAAHLGTQHTEYYCREQDVLEQIPELSWYCDEPLGDISAIPTFLVSKLAREQVTVALSGDGGDETFAGYTRYQIMQDNHSKISRLPLYLSKSLGRGIEGLGKTGILHKKRYAFASLAQLLKRNGPEYNKRAWQRISDEEAGGLFAGSPAVRYQTALDSGSVLAGHVPELSKIMAIDYKTYMVDYILAKVDRATMAVSLEGREPLLDHRIIEFAARLPIAFKYQNGVKKRILRDIVHEYIPAELMERPKMGFLFPLNSWLQGELKPQILHYLGRERLTAQGIFHPGEVEKILQRFYGHQDMFAGLLIWYLFVFERWYERWM